MWWPPRWRWRTAWYGPGFWCWCAWAPRRAPELPTESSRDRLESHSDPSSSGPWDPAGCRSTVLMGEGRGRKEASRATAAEQREVTLRNQRRIDQKHRDQVKTTAEMSAVLIISCWAQAVPNKCVRGDQRFPRQKKSTLGLLCFPPHLFTQSMLTINPH